MHGAADIATHSPLQCCSSNTPLGGCQRRREVRAPCILVTLPSPYTAQVGREQQLLMLASLHNPGGESDMDTQSSSLPPSQPPRGAWRNIRGMSCICLSPLPPPPCSSTGRKQGEICGSSHALLPREQSLTLHQQRAPLCWCTTPTGPPLRLAPI